MRRAGIEPAVGFHPAAPPSAPQTSGRRAFHHNYTIMAHPVQQSPENSRKSIDRANITRSSRGFESCRSCLTGAGVGRSGNGSESGKGLWCKGSTSAFQAGEWGYESLPWSLKDSGRASRWVTAPGSKPGATTLRAAPEPGGFDSLLFRCFVPFRRAPRAPGRAVRHQSSKLDRRVQLPRGTLGNRLTGRLPDFESGRGGSNPPSRFWTERILSEPGDEEYSPSSHSFQQLDP